MGNSSICYRRANGFVPTAIRQNFEGEIQETTNHINTIQPVAGISPMKDTHKNGSIRPTIGGYGRQKTGAVDSNTPSKGGRIGLEESERTAPKIGATHKDHELANLALSELPKKRKIKNQSQYSFFEREATIASRNQIDRNQICPFCLRNKVVRWGKRYNKKSGAAIQRFGCLNCGKRHSLSRFFRRTKPDYLIDAFLDVISINPLLSTRQIKKMIFQRTNKVVSHTTIMYWRNDLRKGKLYDFYLPNSKLNKINKPKTNYIPKTVKYQLYGHDVSVNYSRRRKQDILEKVAIYDKKIVRAGILRKIMGISKLTKPSDTFLNGRGLIEHLGNGFYYVNVGTQPESENGIQIKTPLGEN